MTTLTSESKALLVDIPYPPLKYGSNELRSRLADVEAAAAKAERKQIATAFEPLWDHWYNGIGWFDGYHDQRGTDYSLTQMTVTDYERLSDLMVTFRAIFQPEAKS